MLKDNNVNTVASRERASSALPEWMKFPTLAEVFDQPPSKTIAHLTARHKEYQALEKTGAAADRVLARLISISYARTCALIQELEVAQSEINKKQATEAEKVR